MNNQSTSYGKTLYTRVSRAAAKKHYNSGGTLYVITSNMPLTSLTAQARKEKCFLYPTFISVFVDEKPFDFVVNAISYYWCNKEMGTYLKYFIQSDIKDGDSNA